jgi:transcriptional regulator with XRE-family HTH domain
MLNDWSPEGFADTIAEIRHALDLGMQDVARLAGISRSQASRWGHGKHQPAYASVRQLAIAVRRRGRRDLADMLMKSAGYAALPEGEPAPEPELIPADEWERAVLSDPDLPPDMARSIIEASRAARAAYPAAPPVSPVVPSSSSPAGRHRAAG